MGDAISWIGAYGRGARPSYARLLEYLSGGAALFEEFQARLAEDFGVYNNNPRFDSERGWVYGFCRKYRVELLRASVIEGGFEALGVKVLDGAALALALERAREAYEAGYEKRYEAIVTKKKAGQRARAKALRERERAQIEEARARYGPNRLNRFRWSPKVSRAKILAMYAADAAGLPDEALIDGVGYAMYARCEQARRARERLDSGGMLCHNCGGWVTAAAYGAPTECACGQAMSYREYRRSFHAASMPAGRAEALFDAFAAAWEAAKGCADKTRLIDGLLHECHVSVMSGIKGRSACLNLIEGTTSQIRDMLEGLAGAMARS